MDKGTVIKEIESLIEEGKEKVLATKWIAEGIIGARYGVDNAIYASWFAKSISFLRITLEQDNDFLRMFSQLEENYYSNAQEAISILSGLVEYIEKDIIFIKEDNNQFSEANLKRIMERFHKVVRQLRARHENRSTIDIEDEYDVQDLLHALLMLEFDDIRAEEWTPSYMGKSARMDFLLKKEKIVIEVKKTRKGLSDKEIGDQLIVDVDRYKVHPDCSRLICFVYDPEGRIGNPIGLMNDLKDKHQGFAEIIINPL